MSGLTESQDSKTHSSHVKNMFSTRSALLYAAMLQTLPKIAIRKGYGLKSNLYLVYIKSKALCSSGILTRGDSKYVKQKQKKTLHVFLSKKIR